VADRVVIICYTECNIAGIMVDNDDLKHKHLNKFVYF